ncbi:MAG: PD-(D/E)XK nuclease family protein [Actinomycetota bacterium]|nr:PD-(D/E)XK nuclease family protein [Actinomycetota bacterium]
MTTPELAGVPRLAPSDLTFLWAECPRCFWLKVKGVLKRPSAPFPKIFTRLDHQTKDYFFGKRTEEMAEGLRPGRVAFGDRWVRSGPLEVPGHRIPVVLAGRIDTALSFDDGSFAIVDFKTAEPRDEHVPFYGRQLHCYALAAENPAAGTLRLHPVSTLGLLCIEPISMVGLEDGVAYRAESHFLEVPRDDDAFMAFLSQVLFLLERPEPPDAAPGCSFCSYLAAGSLVLLTGLYEH